MFAAGWGIVEDPATGSAAAAFAGVAMAFEPPGDGEHMLIIEQGVEMGRPSLISLGLEVEGGVCARPPSAARRPSSPKERSNCERDPH